MLSLYPEAVGNSPCISILYVLNKVPLFSFLLCGIFLLSSSEDIDNQARFLVYNHVLRYNHCVYQVLTLLNAVFYFPMVIESMCVGNFLIE